MYNLRGSEKLERDYTDKRFRPHLHFIDKFLSCFEIGSFDECWLWQCGVMPNGYGYTTWKHSRRVYAHRLSYEIFIGPIPDGQGVLHHCDTRTCMNPFHFFLGTNTENVIDKVNKGRQARGEKHYRSKVSDVQVLEIRKRLQSGDKVVDLATDYNVSEMLIYRIKNNQTRRYLQSC